MSHGAVESHGGEVEGGITSNSPNNDELCHGSHQELGTSSCCHPGHKHSCSFLEKCLAASRVTLYLA